MSLLAVIANAANQREARHLAELLGLPLVGSDCCEEHDFTLALEWGELGLGIRQTGARASGLVRCDFARGQLAHRRLYGGGTGQAIARAVGISGTFRPLVADLTAGLGRDGFVLASLGARVVLVERHLVVGALLADGLGRAYREAEQDPDLLAIMARIALVVEDGRDWLATRADADRPDVVYLDPMFPERTKSALVKKEMAIFHSLVGMDDDAGELLLVALAHARYRVVVKRPRHAPPLGGREPSHRLAGKSTRFDIYVVKKIPR
ncbi:MAG: class I SAM-dependent methyltransferase [Porticoccaceae bacterium]